ncbi:MAG: hypothetical protein WA790_09300 [Sulfitobacter sp.]
MSQLPHPNDPRHARMFELLRQTEQAAYTTDRLNMTTVRELDDRVAAKIKETALQSLLFSDFKPKKR